MITNPIEVKWNSIIKKNNLDPILGTALKKLNNFNLNFLAIFKYNYYGNNKKYAVFFDGIRPSGFDSTSLVFLWSLSETAQVLSLCHNRDRFTELIECAAYEITTVKNAAIYIVQKSLSQGFLSRETAQLYENRASKYTI